jgi:hypothetical protein
MPTRPELVRLISASRAGTISPEATTPAPLKRGPVGVAGAVAMGVGTGVGEPPQPDIATAPAIEIVRNVIRRLCIISLNLLVSSWPALS